MNKYIVLLRGINISGKNKISMEKLKKHISDLGYKKVITILNSGNIILESNDTKEQITDKLRSLIQKKFNIDVPIYIMSNIELYDIVNNIPALNMKDMYNNIIFIIKPYKVKDVLEKLGPLNEYDTIKVYKNIIYWSFDLKNYTKSNWWHATASSDISSYITIRTNNTISKILKACNNY